jgi:hypothetical protein
MSFFEAILAYPAIVYTVLLGVVLVYWILAIIGLVDFENTGLDLSVEAEPEVDVDLDAGAEVDATGEAHHADGGLQVSTLAAYLVALGLGGVPFSVVVSLLALFSWMISSIAGPWVLPFAPTAFLHFIVGTVLLVASLAFAIPAAAFCVRPMRRLFVTHEAISNISLVGQECVVSTGSVDEEFGRAEVPARGASYYIRVVADTPNNLKRGDVALIIAYDETARLYRIAAVDKV